MEIAGWIWIGFLGLIGVTMVAILAMMAGGKDE